MATDDRERQIRERLAAATPGPWGWFSAACGCQFLKRDDGTEHGSVLISTLDDAIHESDAALIANSPADLAYLLDALAAAREAHEATRERLQATLDDAGKLIAQCHAAREEIGWLRAEIRSQAYIFQDGEKLWLGRALKCAEYPALTAALLREDGDGR